MNKDIIEKMSTLWGPLAPPMVWTTLDDVASEIYSMLPNLPLECSVNNIQLITNKIQNLVACKDHEIRRLYRRVAELEAQLKEVKDV